MNLKSLTCTGCGACENICPSGAIQMKVNEEGFLQPYIDCEKCNGCGLCESVCKKCTLEVRKNSIKYCYAVWASDEIRRVSSSGGAFSVLADYILSENGYVCGASFDKGTMVKHCIIHNREDIWKLRSSKYVQSRMGFIYREIKKLLESEKTVLFSGTPCQVAGLYAYLGNKPDNLYTIDILCHGVPSQQLFDKYLSETYDKCAIENINFRDKCNGWTYKLVLSMEVDGKKCRHICEEDSFYSAFLDRISLRKSCGDCSFARPKRLGDISLGDFWEIWQYKKKLDDRKGTSLVLINSDKGKELFGKVLPNLQLAEEVPFEAAVRGNTTLMKSMPLPWNRDRFFEDLKKYSLKEAVEMNVGKNQIDE